MTDAERRLTADEALERLRAGHERFAAGKARFPTAQREVLAALACRPSWSSTRASASSSSSAWRAT
jgi:hypothetical protein